jgi:phosphoribosylformylglycinamidine synthase
MYRKFNTKTLQISRICVKFYILLEKIMKAKVYVTLKPSVLDPQGKAIQHSAELLGFENVEDIRQGKYFEIALNDNISETLAQETAEKIAKDVLANPVIEDYQVVIGD